MGMDPATMQMIGMLGAGIGGPAIAALSTPEGQELESFSSVPGLNPAEFFTKTNSLMGALGSTLADRASQPVSLRSSYVQQPGVYSGGGLPMPIGVTASDPALGDRSLLTSADNTDFGPVSEMMKNFVMPEGGWGSNAAGVPRTARPSADAGDDAGEPEDYRVDQGDIIYEPREATRRPGAELVRGQDLMAARTAQAAAPAEDFLDDIFAQHGGDTADDFDQGIASAQLLAAALSRGDVDLSALGIM